MTKWSLYQSGKDYENQTRTILTTAWLIWWLLFGDKDYICTINKRKD